MSADELSFLSIVEAAAGLRSKRFSAIDLTNACLARVESFDSKLHSFITLTAGLARERARQADEELRAGTDRGALHGIPIALKDLYLTKGIRTTCHSAVLQNWFPEYDATATVKLTEAGAVLLGKLGMHEFAFGGPSVDAPFPAVKNPWNTAHVTGGSSSGSGAALAAGFCYGALGSDTGGSIRNPAAHCGVVGIKPTYGRVSRYGVVPLSWSQDHAGPMARCVQDCAIMLQALAGFDGKDPASARTAVPEFRASLHQAIRGLKIGLPRANWFDENLGVAPETEAVFNEAVKKLQQLGAEVIDIDGQPFSLARKANQTILVGEAYAYHEKTFQTTPGKFGSSVRRRMLEGAFLSASDYITAQRARAVLNEQMLQNFARVDVFVTPTIARPPDAFDTLDPNEQNLRPNFTNPFNLAGLPAISVPCGFTDGPLPVGMQIVAPAFEEATCFRVAYAYEQATDWHIRRPSV